LIHPQSSHTLVMHVVYSFDVGGLENVIVQLVNRLPAERYQHVLVSLTTLGAMAQRLQPGRAQTLALHKPPGHAVPLYPQLFRLFRQWRPAVVHTCNLAALEVQPLAWAAGVPRRIHAEHGWDAADPQGHNRKYQWLRRAYRPFVSHYVTVSDDLCAYLTHKVGVPATRQSLIPNGVDTDLFAPLPPPMHGQAAQVVPGCPFVPGQHWLVGTVGRLQSVKNQPLLARAFVQWLAQRPEAAVDARLLLVGEGPLRAEVESVLRSAGLAHLAWLPGARSDIADVLRMLNVFVLPSQAEGTSCTLQEAMATGLPAIATAVGGTPQLLQHGVHGQLVPSDDVAAMAQALDHYWLHRHMACQHGQVARAHALQHFGVEAMVQRYDALFGPGGDSTLLDYSAS